jgi:maleylacetoacetate isomerase
MTTTLFGYWRSSASYRVRIALNLKGVAYDTVPVNLLHREQAGEAFRAVNPQGLVPFLRDDTTAVAQSLAIIEYLDETHPEPPLLPPGAAARAEARALAQAIACDIHPLNNLRVLRRLKATFGAEQDAIDAWSRHWIEEGLAPIEAQADAPYLLGEQVTIADICLVPQLYNARRVKTDLARFPKLLAIEERLLALPAFAAARPEAQPEAIAAS